MSDTDPFRVHIFCLYLLQLQAIALINTCVIDNVVSDETKKKRKKNREMQIEKRGSPLVQIQRVRYNLDLSQFYQNQYNCI